MQRPSNTGDRAVLTTLFPMSFHVSTWVFLLFPLLGFRLNLTTSHILLFSLPRPSQLLIQLIHLYPIIMLKHHFLHETVLQAGLDAAFLLQAPGDHAYVSQPPYHHQLYLHLHCSTGVSSTCLWHLTHSLSYVPEQLKV